MQANFYLSIKNKIKTYPAQIIGFALLLALYLPQIIYPVLMQDGAILPFSSFKGYMIREFRPFTPLFGVLDPRINLILGTLFFYIFTNLMYRIFFKDIDNLFLKTTFFCVSFLNIFMFYGRFWAPTFIAYIFTITILILPFIWHGKIKNPIALGIINLLAFFIGMIGLQPQFLVAYFVCFWLCVNYLETNHANKNFIKTFFSEYKYVVIPLILATLLYILCNLTIVNSARGDKVLVSSFTMFVDRFDKLVSPIINLKSISFYLILLNVVATIYFIYKSKINKVLATVIHLAMLGIIVFGSFIPELLFGLKGTPVKNLQFYLLSVIYSYLFLANYMSNKSNLSNKKVLTPLKIAIITFVLFGFTANSINNIYAFKTMHLNLKYLRTIDAMALKIKQLKYANIDEVVICTDPTELKPSITIFSFFSNLYFKASPYVYWPTTFDYYKISNLSAGSMGNHNVARLKSKVKQTGNPMDYKIKLKNKKLYVY